MSAYTFRPRWWVALLTLLLVAGMVTAGFWQQGRGLQKQHLQSERARLQALPPVPLLDDPSPPAAGQTRKVVVEGMYAPALTVQLDNQPSQKRPGVHVWTPLVLLSGQHVIVDRGWLPLGAEAMAPPNGVQQVQGHWKRLPVPGMRLGGDTAPGCASPRPERVNYPSLAEARCLFGESTLDGVLELAPEAPGGFQREWAQAGSQEIPPSRHFAYAAQWWLFAATLLILFIKLHLKKTAPAHV